MAKVKTTTFSSIISDLRLTLRAPVDCFLLAEFVQQLVDICRISGWQESLLGLLSTAHCIVRTA